MTDKKVILITGASRGIGEAIAVRLAKKDAILILNYQGNREGAEKTARQVQEKGAEAKIWACDVSDWKETQEMLGMILDTYGKIDVLINNAGITRDNLLMRMTEEEFDRVLEVNLKGAFHTMRFAAREMVRRREGRIVNIASVVGITGNAGQANYAAAKAGLIGMTKTAAQELASRGITVNAVAPGFIETDMTKDLSENVRDMAAKKIPMGKFGRPEHVAAAVEFLIAKEADYITGQVIQVDGGIAM